MEISTKIDNPTSPVINLSGKEIPVELMSHIFSFCHPFEQRLNLTLVNKQFNVIAQNTYKDNKTNLKEAIEFARNEFEFIYKGKKSNMLIEWHRYCAGKCDLSKDRVMELKDYIRKRSDIKPFYPGWAKRTILRHPNFSRVDAQEAISIIKAGKMNFLLRPSSSLLRNTCTITYKKKDDSIFHQRISLDNDFRTFTFSVEKVVITFYSFEEVLKGLDIDK